MKTLNLSVFFFNIVLAALVFHYLPLLRKRSIFFGVTVGDAFRGSDVARGITRIYHLLVWGGTAATLLLLWNLTRTEWSSLGGLLPILQVGFGVAAWVVAWRRTKPYKTLDVPTERVVTLGEPEPRLPGGLIAILAPFIGPAVAAWHLRLEYDHLPARYPVHWNIAGQADRFADKSLLSVFFPVVLSVTVLALIALIALGIHYGARRSTSGERPDWSPRYRRLNVLLFVNLMWILSFLSSITSFGAVISTDAMRLWVWSSLGILAVTVLVFGIRLFRMSMEATGGTDATPDECWHWGIIYYNPNDPAIMVEKRDGPGFTLNFGSRLSWVVAVLILIIGVAPMIVSARL